MLKKQCKIKSVEENKMTRNIHDWKDIVEYLRSEKLLQSIDEKAIRIHGNSQDNYHRGNYQRDRDRILYTTSLRRLSGKTQIFNTGMGEQYRNRLTHTLQVIQIATTISRCLGLNVDLTEAIALGHDIGHGPFGHVGERALNNIMNNCDILDKYDIKLDETQKGFKHNLQGLRILCDLEKKSRFYNGIDITKETLWGIAHHTTIYWDMGDKADMCDNADNVDDKKYKCLLRRDRKNFECPNFAHQGVSFYNKYLEQIKDEESWSFEAFVVKSADDIAQRHHDIEDGIFSNVFEPKAFIEAFNNNFKGTDPYINDIAIKENIKKLETEIMENDGIESEYLLPMLAGFIVDFYVRNYISSVAVKLNECINQYSIETNDSFHVNKIKIWRENDIAKIMSFDSIFGESDYKFKKLLYNRIINSQKAKIMDGKGNYIIRNLFEAYLSTPNQLPDNIVKNLFTDDIVKRLFTDRTFTKEDKKTKAYVGMLRDKLETTTTKKDKEFLSDLCRNICDYIASMTDRYALKQYERLYGSTNLS
jgi:dGTPase